LPEFNYNPALFAEISSARPVGGGMTLKDLALNDAPIKVSFEFSPPKTAEAEESLWKAIRRLEPLSPAFVSVTYGAGGSTRERTHATVKRIVEETKLAPAAHLTCVGAPAREIDEIVQAYWDAGVRHIVALRGDMPDMSGSYKPHPAGYATTPDLIEGIRRAAPFEVSVSCYPERHPDSASIDHDVDLLKRKVDAGASRAIGQFCFDSTTIARLRDRAVAKGVAVPVIPGLMPTTNFKGIARMAAKCGAQVPAWLSRLYEGLDSDVESRRIVAAAVLAEQVQELRALGFDQFHFYTLNQADLTYAACRILGIQPREVSP
jgi:methylenetetrahydrofolate reductase (NADPH)